MLSAGYREEIAWPGGGLPGGTVVYPGGYFPRAYLKATAGLGCVGTAWYTFPASLWITAAAAAGVIGLACYAVQTAVRQASTVCWDAEGISVEGPFARTIPWAGMRSVNVSYFSTRRDRTGGWMQLRIRGKGGVLRVDSDAAGFAPLVSEALRQADRLGLDVTSATRHNAAALVTPGGLRPIL